MKLRLLRSAIVGLATSGLALAGLGCADFAADFSDEIVDGTATALACSIQTSSDGFAPTSGEGTLHAPPFSPSTPEIVARGARVTVTVVLDGTRPELDVDGAGGIEVLDAEALYCDPPDGAEIDAASTTHWVVAMAIADRGDVTLHQGDSLVTRWAPEVREASALSLVVDDADACVVGATCLVRAELLDDEGTPLYAEEDFAWTVEGAADAGPFGSWLQIAPTAAGPVVIDATVLGLTSRIEVAVAADVAE